MAKGIEREKFRIRSEWPLKMKSDCDYFAITLKALSDESGVSRYRLSAICSGIIEWKRKIDKYRELTVITHAFNRIISDRNRRDSAKAWIWEK